MTFFAPLSPLWLSLAFVTSAGLLLLARMAAGYLQRRPLSGIQNALLFGMGVPLVGIAISSFVANSNGGGWLALIFACLVLLPLLLSVITDLRGHEIYYAVLYVGAAMVALGDMTVFYHLRDFGYDPVLTGIAGELIEGRFRAIGGILLLGGIFAGLRLLGWLLLRNTRLVEEAPTEDDPIDAVMGSGDTALAIFIGAALGPLMGLVAVVLGIMVFGSHALIIFIPDNRFHFHEVNYTLEFLFRANSHLQWDSVST